MELCPVWYQYGLPHRAEDAELKVVQGPKASQEWEATQEGEKMQEAQEVQEEEEVQMK